MAAKENTKTKPQDFEEMLEKKPEATDKPKAGPSIPAANIAGNPDRKVISLNGTRIQQTGYLRNSWDITAPVGTTVLDLLVPKFYEHVAQNLRPYDMLNVICEDGSWYAQLLVINADRLWAKVHLLMQADLTASFRNMPTAQEEEYEVVWNPINKYTILKKDQRGMPPLKDGFITKLEAYQWLDGHIKALNR